MTDSHLLSYKKPVGEGYDTDKTSKFSQGEASDAEDGCVNPRQRCVWSIAWQQTAQHADALDIRLIRDASLSPGFICWQEASKRNRCYFAFWSFAINKHEGGSGGARSDGFHAARFPQSALRCQKKKLIHLKREMPGFLISLKLIRCRYDGRGGCPMEVTRC